MYVDLFTVFVIYLYMCICCRVPGGELIERILLDNDLTEGVIVRYLSQLLAALDCLHQMNIAHLDIKVGSNLDITCTMALNFVVQI